MTYEKAKLAFFIEQSRERQAEIIKAAQSGNDPAISGPLILAYKLIFDNIR
jgi:hypothetical protein